MLFGLIIPSRNNVTEDRARKSANPSKSHLPSLARGATSPHSSPHDAHSGGRVGASLPQRHIVHRSALGRGHPPPAAAPSAQTGVHLAGEQVCCFSVGAGFPQTLMGSLFGKQESEDSNTCTQEMPPSALQRVCPSWQRAQPHRASSEPVSWERPVMCQGQLLGFSWVLCSAGPVW